MKKYIKTTLVIIAAILTTNIASAQEGRPQGPPQLPDDEQIEEMVADLAKTLSLNEEQEEKVSDLYFDHYDKAAEQQKKNKGSRGAGREAMEKLNAELEESVNTLLNDEQKKLYSTYLEEQKAKRGKRGGPQGKKK